MLQLIALIAFFTITALKDFGVAFKYWDLLRGISCVIIALSLILGSNLGF